VERVVRSELMTHSICTTAWSFASSLPSSFWVVVLEASRMVLADVVLRSMVDRAVCAREAARAEWWISWFQPLRSSAMSGPYGCHQAIQFSTSAPAPKAIIESYEALRRASLFRSFGFCWRLASEAADAMPRKAGDSVFFRR